MSSRLELEVGTDVLLLETGYSLLLESDPVKEHFISNLESRQVFNYTEKEVGEHTEKMVGEYTERMIGEHAGKMIGIYTGRQ